MTRITDTLRGDVCTFITISCPFLLRMKDVSDKICRENQNTHFMFSNLFFFRKSRRFIDVEKDCTAGQATDENMTRAHCMMGYVRPQLHTQNM